jgi:signal peptidase I
MAIGTWHCLASLPSSAEPTRHRLTPIPDNDMATWIRDNRGFLIFLLLLGVFRTAVADYNHIPTGSMRPTLIEGDVVLVNRLAYDVKLPLTDRILAHLDEPLRGDVVTFSSPKDGTRLIKRLVAVPGDRVALSGGVLWINGEPARYADAHMVSERLGARTLNALRAFESIDGREHAVQYLRQPAAQPAFGPFTVPPDHYFMLGDNRDNSEDSRFIGPVPRHLLIGRAHRVLLSLDLRGDGLFRRERTLRAIQ